MIGLRAPARPIVLAIVMILTLAACGQKPGVHVRGLGNAGPGLGGSGDGAGPGGSTGTGPGGTGPGGTGPGGTGPGGTGPGGTGPGGTGTSPTGSNPASQPGADRTGISSSEIRIGLHAPLSGAAPISPEAFRAGAPVYWKANKIHGRKVTVYVEDDKYKPSDARTRCNSLAVEKKVFLIIGAAGTDQIKSCADYSDDRGIPYLSAGVQEAKVEDLGTYSALTMTYAQQMPLLAQYIKWLGANEDRYGPNSSTQIKDNVIKVAFIRPDSNNFNDAEAAFLKAMKSISPPAGKTYKTYVKVVEKEGTAANASNVGQFLIQEGVDIVSPITAPNFTAVLLAGYTGGQSYFPRYMGVGITNGVNQAINRACDRNQFDGAVFFSPFPGWKDRQNFDPEFDKAINNDSIARPYNQPRSGGDILLAIWGIMKDIHRILEAAGPNLTRQSVIQMMNTFSTRTNFFPDLAFEPPSPFGASNVHALVGECDRDQGGPWFIEDPKHFGLRASF